MLFGYQNIICHTSHPQTAPFRSFTFPLRTWKVPEAPFPVICSRNPFSTDLCRQFFSTSGLKDKHLAHQYLCMHDNQGSTGQSWSSGSIGSTVFMNVYLLSTLSWGKCCSRYFLMRMYEASLGSQRRVMISGRASPSVPPFVPEKLEVEGFYQIVEMD